MGAIKEFFGLEPPPQIEVFQSPANGQWYFRVVARNHKVVCQSEGYTRKASCFRGIKALTRAVEAAEVNEVPV